MKHLSTSILLICIFHFQATAQDYFEGKIVYKTTYTPLSKNIDQAFLDATFGSKMTALIKEDKFLIISESPRGKDKTIYLLKEGYSYHENEYSDTIEVHKLSKYENILDSIYMNQDSVEVLGKLCPQITMVLRPMNKDDFYEKIEGTYAYHKALKLNPAYYEPYNRMHWNQYINLAKAVSIRNENHYHPVFKSVSEAISIDKVPIAEEAFEINPYKTLVYK